MEILKEISNIGIIPVVKINDAAKAVPLAKALAQGSGGKWYADIDSLLPELKKLLRKGDTVLVKASHSMQFERIVSFLNE